MPDSETPSQGKETFSDFRKSFFYGSRSDLSFKFLSDLPDDSSADFIQDLFSSLVNALDDNDLESIKQRLVQGQVKGYALQKNFDYDTGPFQPLKSPLSDLKLSLLTSSGHFLAEDDPMPLGIENMSQKEAESRIFDFLKEEPFLSKIPFDADPLSLKVRHGGYDTRAARKDPHVNLPLGPMRALEEEGVFAELTPHAYSFVGACSQKRLMKKTLPDWVDLMKEQAVDAVVLVPV